MTRSNLHVVTGHNGSSWLEDTLVEGDFEAKVRELLGGEPERCRVLIPGASQAFYRGSTTVLVMTFKPDVRPDEARTWVHRIKDDRDDLN